MDATEQALRDVGFNDRMLNPGPDAVVRVSAEQMRTLTNHRKNAGACARGAYIAEWDGGFSKGDPYHSWDKPYVLADLRDGDYKAARWAFPGLAANAVAEPQDARAYKALDDLLAAPADGPLVDRDAPSVLSDLMHDSDFLCPRAGVYVCAHETAEEGTVVDVFSGVSREKLAEAARMVEGEQDDPRHMTQWTAEQCFGPERARLHIGETADMPALDRLTRVIATPGLGWVPDDDVRSVLSRALRTDAREADRRALVEYAFTVRDAALDMPAAFAHECGLEGSLGDYMRAGERLIAAESAADMSHEDIETVAEGGRWLRLATDTAGRALRDPGLKISDRFREALDTFALDKRGLELTDGFDAAVSNEARRRADALGSRVPETREEMSIWYKATTDRVWEVASEKPEGPGRHLVIGGDRYLTEEKQDALLDCDWKRDAFTYLTIAEMGGWLDGAIDAWAKHAGDRDWLTDTSAEATNDLANSPYEPDLCEIELGEEDFEDPGDGDGGPGNR